MMRQYTTLGCGLFCPREFSCAREMPIGTTQPSVDKKMCLVFFFFFFFFFFGSMFQVMGSLAWPEEDALEGWRKMSC